MTDGGMLVKEEGNSRSLPSSSCQFDGTIPVSSSMAPGDELENVIVSCMVPCPHGEAEGARNESLVVVRKMALDFLEGSPY